MASDRANLTIDWQGKPENKIGEIVCTIEVDKDSMAGFEDKLKAACGTIDMTAHIEGLSALREAISKFVSYGTQASIDVYDRLSDAAAQMATPMEEFVRKFVEQYEPVVELDNRYFNGLVVAYEIGSDCEIAYRKYVHILNWKRPRGKKLSWRRLNRPQRLEAIRWYPSEYGMDGLDSPFYEL